GPRHYSVLLAQFGAFSPANFRINISAGKSRYDGVNVGIRHQMRNRFSFNAWYSLSRAKSLGGNGVDELSAANIQNHLDPFVDVHYGLISRTYARLKITVSAVVGLPMGFQAAPVYRFRSALPVNITEGVDLNQNGDNTDIAGRAFAYDGLDGTHNPIVKDLGAC